jgi:hypothetical protein
VSFSKYSWACALIFLFGAYNSFADESPETIAGPANTESVAPDLDHVKAVKKEEESSVKEVSTGKESWYLMIGMGLGGSSYTAELDSTVKALEARPNVTNNNLYIELLSFYFPLVDHKLLLGGVLCGATNIFTNDTKSLNVSITTGSVLLSSMYFFGESAGDGLFFRGDIGKGDLEVDVEKAELSGVTNKSSSVDSTYQLGIGYGLTNSTKTTRVLLGLISRQDNSSIGDISSTYLWVAALF